MFQPYLDGEFQVEERLEVETHLSGCAGCAQRFQGEVRRHHSLRQATRRALQSTPAPEALRARLREGLGHEQRRATQTRWLRASAAALVVGVAGTAALSFHPGHRQRFIEDAARRHAKRLPPEVVGSSPENFEAWLDGKLDHRVSVPNLPNLQLAGIRLSHVTDRPAAYISYEAPRSAGAAGAPARRIGVFVFDDAQGDVEAAPLPAVEVGKSLGYNVAVWRENEVVYELVSDLDESDIRRMLTQQTLAKAQTPRPATPDAVIQPVSLP